MMATATLTEFDIVRSIFIVAPNPISADKTSRKSPESAVQSVLRSHKLREIGRGSAYYDHPKLFCKQRRTRWRMMQV